MVASVHTLFEDKLILMHVRFPPHTTAPPLPLPNQPFLFFEHHATPALASPHTISTSPKGNATFTTLSHFAPPCHTQAEEVAATKARRLDERLAQLESTALATSEDATLRLRQIEQSSEASATAAAAAAAVITNKAEGEAVATCAAAAVATKAAEEAGARAERDAAAAAAAGADVDLRVALVEEMEGRLRVLQQQLEARRGR